MPETANFSAIDFKGAPSHWTIKRFKHLATINNGLDYKHVQAVQGHPVIGSGGQFAYANAYLYDGEAVLLGRKGTIDKPLYVNGKFWTVDTMFYAVCTKAADTKYVYYLATTIPFSFYSTSTALPSMTQSDLMNHSFAVPPKPEQTAIANFIDQKTTQIDKAIRVKEQQITLLKERKQILIQNAVTRGLNPNAPMRDSGVEWIGEVPGHWELLRLKNVSSFVTSGPRGWSEHFSEQGAYFLQSGDLNESMGVELEGAVRVNPPKGAEGLRTRLLRGDVLICITGAKTGKVSLAELSDRQEAYINQHLCLVRPIKNVLPEYLAVTLYSGIGQTYFFLQQYGLKQGLGLEDVNEAPILLPPLEEQEGIVNYINTETAKQDKVVSLLDQQITKLKEYKATLINSAVTGKIKVPGVVEPAEQHAFMEETGEPHHG